jgi:hypothetical protein
MATILWIDLNLENFVINIWGIFIVSFTILMAYIVIKEILKKKNK